MFRSHLDQMVGDMHRALVTAPATDLNPHPQPGLVDQVTAIQAHLGDQDRHLEVKTFDWQPSTLSYTLTAVLL